MSISGRRDGKALICKSCQVFLVAGNSVHFGPTLGATAFYSRLTIFRFNSLGMAHLPFGAACHTICLHLHTSPFSVINDG